MKLKPLIAILCCSPLLLAGCGTVAGLYGKATGRCDGYSGHTIPRVYSGVAIDMSYIRDGAEDSYVLVLDLPVSAAADTLVLPYTLWAQSKHGNLYDRQPAPKIMPHE